MRVDSEYLANYIERCADNGAPMHLTPMERRFIADAIRIAAQKTPAPEERATVLEEAAKVCVSMYAKDKRSVGAECLLDAASAIRDLKRSEPQKREDQ